MLITYALEGLEAVPLEVEVTPKAVRLLDRRDGQDGEVVTDG
jgi:hypothetical protein